MPLTQEGAKLILKGVDILEKIDDDQFDMTSWRSKILTVSGCDEKANECQTTCCLLGWMATTPEAAAAGVAFGKKAEWSVPDSQGDEGDPEDDKPVVKYDYGFATTGKRSEELDSDEAIKRLTGLVRYRPGVGGDDYSIVDSLFFKEGTRQQVIKRTPMIVAEHFPEIVKAWRARKAARQAAAAAKKKGKVKK